MGSAFYSRAVVNSQISAHGLGVLLSLNYVDIVSLPVTSQEITSQYAGLLWILSPMYEFSSLSVLNIAGLFNFDLLHR